MAAGQPVPQKKSNTCLILLIILFVIGFLFLGSGVVLLKVIPGLIYNKLSGTQTSLTSNPLKNVVGNLTGGNDSGSGGSGKSSDEDIAFSQCTPGKSALGVGIAAGFAYTGKETFNIDGQSVSLCCMSPYDVSQGQLLANAEDKMCGDNRDTLVYLHKVDGKFLPYLAGYKKNGQDCSITYDNAGIVISNYCGQ